MSIQQGQTITAFIELGVAFLLLIVVAYIAHYQKTVEKYHKSVKEYHATLNQLARLPQEKSEVKK